MTRHATRRSATAKDRTKQLPFVCRAFSLVIATITVILPMIVINISSERTVERTAVDIISCDASSEWLPSVPFKSNSASNVRLS
ncbi:hypothetical protein CEXT_544431 [Caerostris extrusa]|uniref:Uncharacterized protein n=1 Tax=Caerostris extrusa TaxID=172846 RepID=A0AAV4RQ62_CAEEX|nr:hypothetical protein CEXT_544431 [Caerostris extrusa]